MFIQASYDLVAQIGDSTRISLSKTFSPKGSPLIQKIEIDPDASGNFVDITGTLPLNSKNWFIDWVYLTSGVKTLTVRVTQVGLILNEKSFQIKILSETEDLLFSNDNDLTSLESDLLSYLPQGRSNFNYIHRKVQDEILDWLDSIRVTRQNGDRLQAIDLNSVKDIKMLSSKWALKNIFFELSNKSDDKFYQKHLAYKAEVETIKSRGRIQADINQDGLPEKLDFKSSRLVRR